MTLLFVDDNQSLAEFTVRNIRSLRPRWTVVSARNLEEARKIASTMMPVAAIIDICLPDGNGVELLRELLEREPRLPVIMITASPSESLRDQVRQVGGYTVMEKPYLVDSLLQVVESSLSHHTAAEEPEEGLDINRPDRAPLDVHLAQNRLSSLLVGIRSFAADIRTAGKDDAEIIRVADDYTDRLCALVMELSFMLTKSSRRRPGDDGNGN